MVVEGLIDKKTALGRVTPEQIDQMLHPILRMQTLKQQRMKVVSTPRA
jgi:hypothetical protein